MPRFYCPQPMAVGETITLPDQVAHHAWVVRLLAGAALTLFNGDGGEYAAELAELGKKSATARVIAFVPRECELAYEITLAQALPEAAKMDWIIEKAVELGVAAIQPLAAQRCVVRLSAERAEKKQGHWQAVIVSASEQSGRNRLARLGQLCDVGQWIARADMADCLLLTPRATQSLADWSRATPPRAISLMIGPEGGFTQQEEDAAIARGAIALSMGPRILRTETAALAALAAISAVWDGA
ncbi:16S rRNA (uracil(1498)-N(3))-methyltransferase [Massilia psychrophila]|uniref:Ribosomal RNA small subunit methyltransferase E n=1 Tax=Massilia psychrophila TaxID=1603353 RepID=A0A2G8T5I4_9BURK|nr:16S rRNA (uracil(1498)-N(3))-methyltransferase [Massilia psychrophila]PIL41320.1 16S rRNA (uracil(1498)-N(3))-methyltransferase [Massilia psychrophila]GGE65046.1 ribosomal RNA small subunit methyltransferase E [Massilia psychrophila]